MKALPKMIEKRISLLSSNEDIFNKEITYYRDALSAAGHKDLELKYSPVCNKKRQRTRQVTWFNPPFNSAVKTNVGELFLKLVDRYLKSDPKLGKVFNRSTLKVSYSTTRNMRQHLDKHNMAILNSKTERPEGGCNCRKPNECPLSNKCLTKEVVYKAEVVEASGEKNDYYGLTELRFKDRYYGHTANFRDRTKAGTELSNHIWKLRDEAKDHTIKWSIKTRAFAYRDSSKYCDLCLSEKTAICLADPKCTLNSRKELMNKCRHKWKYKLARFLEKPPKKPPAKPP